MADRFRDVELLVNGQRYSGWKSVRVTRSIENMAGSFALTATDQWGNGEPWPIAEEDACQVLIGGEVVISGHVSKRTPSLSDSERSLGYSGYDRAAALVENSLVLKHWTFRNMTLLEFASTIAKPWGIKVSVQPGLVLKKRSKIVVQPGDKGYDTLAREAAEDGVLLVSDGAGGIVITRAGADRATSLVEGVNIKAASADYDSSDRFYRYVVMTQTAGTDEASGDATRVLAEAFDEGVRRKDRVCLIRPEKSYSVADARKRADWEARVRAARAEPVSVTVQGWKQADGRAWPVNALARVVAPSIGVEGTMIISQVDAAIDSQGGRVTQLKLLRPDAFAPEPKATVKASGGAWKELAKGAL